MRRELPVPAALDTWAGEHERQPVRPTRGNASARQHNSHAPGTGICRCGVSRGDMHDCSTCAGRALGATLLSLVRGHLVMYDERTIDAASTPGIPPTYTVSAAPQRPATLSCQASPMACAVSLCPTPPPPRPSPLFSSSNTRTPTPGRTWAPAPAAPYARQRLRLRPATSPRSTPRCPSALPAVAGLPIEQPHAHQLGSAERQQTAASTNTPAAVVPDAICCGGRDLIFAAPALQRDNDTDGTTISTAIAAVPCPTSAAATTVPQPAAC